MVTPSPHSLPARLCLGRHHRTRAILATACLLSLPTGTSAADTGEALAPITVTTLRTSQGRPLSSIPGSVTVIEEEAIEEQTRTNRDLGEILSNLVPGLGQSSENLTNFGQSLRGRSFLVMIDGVPQNAVLRQAFKHLRSISPEAIERIEVIRGAVATYGIGATGGVINFITKSGQGTNGHAGQTTLAVTGQEESSESLGGRVYQGLRGDQGAMDYSVNLSAGETGSWYDGNDNLIPPDGFSSQGGGLAESSEYNLQTKLGYQIGSNQRLQFSLNYYDHTQDPENRRDPASGDPQSDEPTQALAGAPQGEEPRTENFNISLDHTLENFAGGTLSTQIYYQDYETIFGFFSGFESGPGQTFLETRHTGLRVAHDRPFGNFHAVYGIDAGTETTAQNFLDGRTNMSELDQTNYAPFVQLEAPLGESWLVKGGVRHERVGVDIPTFQDESVNNPGTVRGGELDYDETVFNLGAVYFLTRAQEVFAGFSQGFSVADIGRALREQSAAGNTVDAEAFNPEAQVVDNYELGWRGRFGGWQATLTGFYNTSDLGTTFGGPPDFQLQQRKEEIYGVEVTLGLQATSALSVDATGSWQRGRVDTDGDGDVDHPLPGTRIAPPELTVHAEYSPAGWWSTHAQAKHLFDRGEFDNSTAFGEGAVDGYTLVDISAEGGVGPGTLSLGIDNVFDEKYITTLGQAYNLPGYVISGRGRTYNISYTVQY